MEENPIKFNHPRRQMSKALCQFASAKGLVDLGIDASVNGRVVNL
jgi:hypothetical protein